MIIDLQTTFSGTTSAAGVKLGQAITATAISTNVVDLRSPKSTPALVDEAIGLQDLWLVVQADQSADFTSGGASTLTITLESDSTADLATSATVHFSTAAIAKASLVKGFYALRTKLPLGDYEQFLGLRYTVAVANFTAGGLYAYLTPALDKSPTYPSGFSVV